jgi:aminoglycoside phosphotransferase (APT) family kinase protein
MLPGRFGCLPAMTGRNFTVDTITPYLIERNLVGLDAIVEGDLEIIDVGRRNQNLKIVRRRGSSYLIKQAGEGEFATSATLRCEAWFYAHCLSDPGAAALRDFLPALHAWDEDRGLLVLELVDGHPLWVHYAGTPDPEFSSDAAAPLGDALGTLHRVFRQSDSRPGWMAELATAPPWILFADRPTPDMYARLSPAHTQVLRILQKNGPVTLGLDRLRREWLTETVIHNDMKGDNVLASAMTENGIRVRIIDWELIQIGDPAWDVGAVFRDFLNYWLLSVPLSGDLSPEEMLEGAHVPLATLHPAVRAFWQAYRAAAQLDAEVDGIFLLRSLRFAAARMAQGAYELSSNMAEPSNLAVAMLQLAANLLADPREASIHLFGIPVPWRRFGDASLGE